jgi:uncharacterized protein (UPF0332 family)
VKVILFVTYASQLVVFLRVYVLIIGYNIKKHQGVNLFNSLFKNSVTLAVLQTRFLKRLGDDLKKNRKS